MKFLIPCLMFAGGWNRAGSRLFVADPRAKKIFAANWSGWFAPVADAFTTAADQTMVPQLGNTWG